MKFMSLMSFDQRTCFHPPKLSYLKIINSHFTHGDKLLLKPFSLVIQVICDENVVLDTLVVVAMEDCLNVCFFPNFADLDRNLCVLGSLSFFGLWVVLGDWGTEL